MTTTLTESSDMSSLSLALKYCQPFCVGASLSRFAPSCFRAQVFAAALVFDQQRLDPEEIDATARRRIILVSCPESNLSALARRLKYSLEHPAGLLDPLLAFDHQIDPRGSQQSFHRVGRLLAHHCGHRLRLRDRRGALLWCGRLGSHVPKVTFQPFRVNWRNPLFVRLTKPVPNP